MNDFNNRVVVGIDGGGTHSRVMVADTKGMILSYVERGSSSIYKDLQARENVYQALKQALHESGKDISEVVTLVAGIAGYDSKADLNWVERLTDLPELKCAKLHVNDAVVAHSGALLSEPGIIVISGTGSIIFSVTEEGKQIRNYDLHQYAASAARFLGYDAIYELLAGNVQEQDQQLVQSMLQFWGVTSVEQLSLLALKGFITDQRERDRRFSELAPIVTENAMKLSPLAQTVCNRAIHKITVGVKILASYFLESEVKVSLIGSVVNSEYFQQQLSSRMIEGNNKKYRLVSPAFSPVAGAVLMALKQLDIIITPELLENLALHTNSRHK
ncbi:BadF/BadG/BcrA/BcrD ATPase family protein [Paenibacillus endoradicis]|uniref:BadF/BadG/BcrA/BcrD ATPase family protein n=1 Tax=Paenibacillus endoradicis TaxID=2972487 RepID=UPI002159A775|nr:BadF/BadG/BcrA/BcrD ATPase family protein [Paenibacillus endoradicis]MCR8660637.1 ATPase [Paenibacillus endoradicis]